MAKGGSSAAACLIRLMVTDMDEAGRALEPMLGTFTASLLGHPSANSYSPHLLSSSIHFPINTKQSSLIRHLCETVSKNQAQPV